MGGGRDSGVWYNKPQDASWQVSQDGDSRHAGQFTHGSHKDSAEKPVHVLRWVSRWREVWWKARSGEEEVRQSGGGSWIPACQMASPEAPSSTSGTSPGWVLS